ncbi:MAG: glycosyltransferase [Planctomycetes bacterium]|nr:glycosyltransferase [Planctomycetota bacterium]
MLISVVINTYNRATSLPRTLAALRQQRYRDFEVVVVNGPSTDGTASLLEAWQDACVIRRCPEINISMSRNVGIAAASGDVVAFIDDDAIPEPDWLEKLAEPYADPQVAGVGGIVWDHTGVRHQYRFSLCDRLGRTHFTGEQPDYRSIPAGAERFIYLQGTNSSFRRDVLAAIGGFDEEIEYFHDETDVAARVNDLGLLLVPLPDGAVHHKYLASHLRTTGRIVLEPYPNVKNSWYFALLHGRDRHPWDAIHSHLVAYTAGVAGHATGALRDGLMTKQQFDYFMQRVTEGQQRGLELGRAGRRRLGSIPAADRSRFKPFPTIRPEGRRLTLCFVSNEYPPDDFGGIGRYTCDLAESLAAAGHQVHVITRSPDHDRIDWEQGPWVHRVQPRAGGIAATEAATFEAAPNLIHCARIHDEVLRLNRRFPLDLVSAPLWNVEGLLCQLDDRLPVALTLMTSRKTVGEIDPTLAIGETWRQQLALERQAVRTATHIHAISHAILEKTLHDHGPSAAAAAVCHLGVRDPRDRFARSRPDDGGEVRILCVGRLEARKGTDVLLAAAERVCGADRRARFVLVGKDAGGNGVTSYAKDFTSRAPALVADRRVVFEGAVSDDALQQHYADADLFVLPSRFESFGLVLLEAMAFGLPLVASAIGGITEIVDDAVGLLVEPGSVESLAGALVRLCDDASLRRRLGAEARARFAERWSIEAAARRTAATYADFADGCRDRVLQADDGLARERLIERLAGLAKEEAALLALDTRLARAILDPARSIDIVEPVLAAWYRSDGTFIRKVFAAILGREADAEATAYFTGMLRRGDSRRDVVAHIATSPEAKSLGVTDEWLRLLPETDTLERRPHIFRIWSITQQVPRLLGPNGLIRQELRRQRRRRKASREQRRAA